MLSYGKKVCIGSPFLLTVAQNFCLGLPEPFETWIVGRVPCCLALFGFVEPVVPGWDVFELTQQCGDPVVHVHDGYSTRQMRTPVAVI